ncbi:hypothetical protein R1T16_11780 [Flavobacterium sp. DG1-102-2]|uniref:hypothetical protein n=1 Tax=Flavobacterium sp. DG1-102-2 TaxID=3081663 RepID=UPI00294A0B1C|nr:hypothetical protein [Flavobacterium sp. DG1-102-2]MDV6169105.1 hypothetical protein [Flavobacterium sp. DG1-102-2]
MKTKFLFLLLLLLPLAALAQKRPRQILHGKVVADSIAVDNITVLNTNSKIRAVTDAEGSFTIYARAEDTLYFYGTAFRDASLGLKEAHLAENPLMIGLNVDVTVLNEIVITANPLTGELAKDSKNTKTLRLNKDLDNETAQKLDLPPVSKANVNTALPQMSSPLTGVDFVQVYKMIFKKKPKKKDKGEIYGTPGVKTFAETVKERYTYHFFTQTLKIPGEDIGKFLVYCDEAEDSAWLLDPKKDFELTDYLVVKSKDYLKNEK